MKRFRDKRGKMYEIFYRPLVKIPGKDEWVQGVLYSKIVNVVKNNRHSMTYRGYYVMTEDELNSTFNDGKTNR